MLCSFMKRGRPVMCCAHNCLALFHTDSNISIVLQFWSHQANDPRAFVSLLLLSPSFPPSVSYHAAERAVSWIIRCTALDSFVGELDIGRWRFTEYCASRVSEASIGSVGLGFTKHDGTTIWLTFVPISRSCHIPEAPLPSAFA